MVIYCNLIVTTPSWLVAFATFGAGSSFGVYQDFYTHQGTAGSSNISWIGSLQFFLMFATGLPAGKMLDSGYFHHAQITGAALYILSSVFAPSPRWPCD